MFHLESKLRQINNFLMILNNSLVMIYNQIFKQFTIHNYIAIIFPYDLNYLIKFI